MFKSARVTQQSWGMLLCGLLLVLSFAGGSLPILILDDDELSTFPAISLRGSIVHGDTQHLPPLVLAFVTALMLLVTTLWWGIVSIRVAAPVMRTVAIFRQRGPPSRFIYA